MATSARPSPPEAPVTRTRMPGATLGIQSGKWGVAPYNDVGVDVEIRRDVRFLEIAASTFSTVETDALRGLEAEQLAQGFYACWTRKEALVKALGNPAKMTDPRAKWYIKKYGSMSWEVDALPPEVMQRIVNDSIREYVDNDMMEKIKVQEEKDKRKLKRLTSKF